ncbi:MAG: acyltransferase family protein [Turicibacter sp.]
MKKRDQLLDFIKGLAIISVILIHNIPDAILDETYYWYHIGQAVPLFMMVTGYLGYQKYANSNRVLPTRHDLFKVIRSVFIPFVVVTLIQIVCKLLLGTFNPESLEKYGGIGPGSYYPYIFVQASIILPLIVYQFKLFRSQVISILMMIGICILLNIFIAAIDLPKDLYRLSILRYIFYIYLGCLWKKEGFSWSIKWIIFIVTGGLFAWFQCYDFINLSPLIYNSWRGYAWITAGYTVGVILVIQWFYGYVKEYRVANLICYLGKNSYLIFLTQLFVFSMFKRKYLYFIEDTFVLNVTYVSLTFLFSMIPVVVKGIRKGEIVVKGIVNMKLSNKLSNLVK